MDNSALLAIKRIDKLINYNDPNFQRVYLSLQKKLNIGKYLKYQENRPEQFRGVFHFALSVRVSSDTVGGKGNIQDAPFIPFLFYTHRNPESLSTINKGVPYLLSGQEQTYNYTQFFNELIEKPGYDEINEIQFVVNLDSTPSRIVEMAILENESLAGSLLSNANRILEEVEARGETHFIQKISSLYRTIGIKRLNFRICAFDDDYISCSKQTYLIFIAQDADEIEYFFVNYVRKVRNLASLIRTRYIYDLLKKDRHEAIKSAIAAIMSRNMSHNLGSHYLYYTKVSLEQLADKTGNAGPEIRGAAKALSYIQSRMDYLATIVSNDKYPYGSVNFKSQILDELTVDDFSKRHYGSNPNEEFRKSLAENAVQLGTVKELVSSLSSLYDDCANLDEHSFTERRELIDDKVSSLQQAIATIDKKSIYNRTTNYLLTNLIRSENYSRPDILGRPRAESFKELFLFVRLWDGKSFELFTGSNSPQEMVKEEGLKDKLSKINLALPGGTMSCHAFYNILENFIRNSAKYSWTDYRQKELRITISLRVDEEKQLVECTIFDNKHDALRYRDSSHGRTLLDDITYRLSHSRILTDNQMIDKENKGLKEMLFSAVWLKANESDKTFAEIISSMEESTPKHKLALIRKYAFEFVSVNDEGNDSNDYNFANLGIRFILPLFTHVESLQGKKINDLIKLHTDVVEVADPSMIVPELGRSYQKVFPRVFSGIVPPIEDNPDITNRVELSNADAEYDSVVKLHHAIGLNLGNIDQYTLRFESMREPGSNRKAPADHMIFFDTHFSTQATKSRIQEYYEKYAYVDTISGNNFTKTLQGLFASGIGTRGKKFKSYNDYYLDLKIKESGLTRITIIDERLFNSVRWNENVSEKLSDDSIPDSFVMDIRSTAAELSMKNIRVLNFLEGKKAARINKCFERVDGLPFFFGNSFFDLGPCRDFPNATHFLSIHLGLIEKLLKSKKLEKYIGKRGTNPLAESRIKDLMQLLESKFGHGISGGVHICVHSGRGNFSKELEGPLRKYPFLSLAALENAFNNSKFLLSQLFYNTIFIGKGEVNH